MAELVVGHLPQALADYKAIIAMGFIANLPTCAAPPHSAKTEGHNILVTLQYSMS